MRNLLLAALLLWALPARAACEYQMHRWAYYVCATAAELPVTARSMGDTGYADDTNAYYVWDGAAWTSVAGGGGGAPSTATYITQTPDAGLSAEQAMSLLGTGLELNTNGTGIQTIYAGATCGGSDKATALSASGALTCSPVAYANVTGTPTIPTDISGASYWTRVAEATLSSESALGSLGTGLVLSTTVTGVPSIYAGSSCGAGTKVISTSASGVVTCTAVSLTADVSGILPTANGGLGLDTSATGADRVPITSGSGFVMRPVASCTDTAGQHLNFTSGAPGTFSCGTTSSSAALNSTEVSISFGTGGGLIFSSTVTGQAWVSATSKISCSPFGTTADGLTVESVAASALTVTTGNRVVGTGFDLFVYSPNGATGTVRFHCLGSAS